MAYDFDGDTDVMKYTLDTGYDSSVYSVAGWINPANTADYGSWYHKGSDYPARHHNMEFNAGWGGLVFVMANGAGVYGAWNVANPSTNVWTHYCVTMDDSSTLNAPLIYKNGVSQSVTQRSAPSGTPVRTSNKLAVANYPDTPSATGNFVGRVGEVGYWNRILTAAEIAALGKGFSPLFFLRGLIGYFPLVRNTSAIKGAFVSAAGNVVYVHPRIIYPRGMR